MFTLSSKSVYGTRALVELAQHYRSGPLQIKDIAARNDIPQHYLEQILSTLRRSGLVRSYRGARGGYELARHPDEVRLIDVLVELEGPLVISTLPAGDDVLSFLWSGLESHLRDFLSKSLGDVLRDKPAVRRDEDFMI